MRRLNSLILLAIAVLASVLWNHYISAPGTAAAPAATPASTTAQPAEARPAALPGFLPPEAHDTLERIARGGPFKHRQDGSVFGNYESLLPKRPRGYYHEYTVETPGSRDRGARRIVTGGTPPTDWYYTDDHYRSFRRFEANR